MKSCAKEFSGEGSRLALAGWKFRVVSDARRLSGRVRKEEARLLRSSEEDGVARWVGLWESARGNSRLWREARLLPARWGNEALAAEKGGPGGGNGGSIQLTGRMMYYGYHNRPAWLCYLNSACPRSSAFKAAHRGVASRLHSQMPQQYIFSRKARLLA